MQDEFFLSFLILQFQRFQKRLDHKKLIQTLRRAMFMTFVLGLPWIFGYVMLLMKDDNLRIIFAAIFTIFNALQVKCKTVL